MPIKREFCHFLKYCLAFFLLTAVAVACSRQGRKFIIPADKMTDVLVDLHLADAIALQNEPVYSGFKLDSARLYQSVFTKHGITRAMFDSTLNYYSAQPEQFQSIYASVTRKLNLMIEEDMNAVDPEPEPKKQELIWQAETIYALPEMGDNNRVAVDIPIKASGNYNLATTIKLYADDESVDPRISLYYWYDDGSEDGFRINFKDVMLAKDGNQHEYNVTQVLTSPVFTHIKGFILNDSNTDTLYRKHALVSDIRVTYIP